MQTKDSTAAAYFVQPDEAFNSKPEPLPADFVFCETQPPPDPDFKESGGRFRKGYDPRRHKFTHAECSRGFWAAIAIWGVSMGEKLHTSGRWPSYVGRRASK